MSKLKKLLSKFSQRINIFKRLEVIEHLASRSSLSLKQQQQALGALRGELQQSESRLQTLQSHLTQQPAQLTVDDLKGCLITQQQTQSGFYAQPAKRSVLFYGNSYYHHYYLAQALRRRGWDVLTVSLHNPASTDSLYYHGEDVNLYSDNPDVFRHNLNQIYEIAKQRYGMFHFANDGVMSFFPEHFSHANDSPPDMVAWKNMGNKIAYTISGCNSCTSQTSVGRWSQLASNGKNVCDTCVHQEAPTVCNDAKSLAWGQKVARFCDLVFAEQLPALDFIDIPQAIREPGTMSLDPMIWHPALKIPEELLIPREKDELLVYHAVGNYTHRTNQSGKNIKGTQHVMAAVERLQAEGMPVRLIFVTDQPNKSVRYIQLQADVVVDQLNYGRYGANARESLMLGKPVIGYINPMELKPESALQSIRECPIVSADEETVYQVLKDLLQDPVRRAEIGQASRQYALKWHSADACAHRYELIYEQMLQGKLNYFPAEWDYFEPMWQTAHYQTPTALSGASGYAFSS